VDIVQGEGGVSRETGRGALFVRFCLLFALSVLLVSGVGCLWGRGAKGPPPLPPGETEEAQAPRPPQAPGSAETPSSPGAAGRPGSAEAPGAASAGAGSPAPAPPQEGAEAVIVPEGASPKASDGAAPSARPKPNGEVPPAGGKGTAVAPMEEPAWAAGKEVLVYRVEFLGMTMGYARFTFKGKVLLNGKETYHLNVRAWTSDILSVIYPINETIDYFLDVKTLAPLRQEFTSRAKEKDDVAIYDQENGKIVYRYKQTGEIHKRVDVTPNVYDPVSATYYFRVRDLGAEERPRQVYAGRKLWQISTRLIGQERIDTSGGPVDTKVIQPVIRREGQLENKGDLRMWVTNDARRVPVRIYAKFRKIRDWTLVADLIPPQEGG